MADDFDRVRRDVVFFLSSLRYSIEHPLRGPIENDEVHEKFTNIMLAIEEARIRFNTYTRYRSAPNERDWYPIKANLLEFAKKFSSPEIANSDFVGRRFFSGPITTRERESPSPFVAHFTADKERRIEVNDAIPIFVDYVSSVSLDGDFTQQILKFEELNKIVPLQQQVAPVQFDVNNGRISVVANPSQPDDADRPNLCAALEHLKDSGDKLISNLENSNCDKRLLESVRELQLQLNRDDNVIKIGLTNIACGIMGAQFKSEMPDAIVAMLNSHNTGVSLYVAQFSDWNRFTQKAAASNLDDDVVAEVDSAAGTVIVALQENSELAAPDVPKTIKAVRELLSLPGATSKRAAFAMIRTLENLVASIIRYSVDFVNKTAELTVELGAKAASKTVVGLLGVALMGATGIGSAAVHTGSPWVKQAIEIIYKQIEKMKD